MHVMQNVYKDMSAYSSYFFTSYDYCFIIDMVVSGIPTRTAFHAREIANMALEIVAACKVFVIPHRPSEPLKIRVGLHSGK